MEKAVLQELSTIKTNLLNLLKSNPESKVITREPLPEYSRFEIIPATETNEIALDLTEIEYEAIKKSLLYSEDYILAAKFGEAEAYYNLAKNENIPEKAIKLFELAVSKNHDKSKKKLGDIFYKKGDYEKAFDMLNQLTDTDSYAKLGIMYRDGLGVEKNIEKMLIYFEKSKNLYESRYELIKYYFYSVKNFDVVLEYMDMEYNKKTLFEKYPTLNSMAGYIYEYAKKDKKKALEYYKRADDQNFYL